MTRCQLLVEAVVDLITSSIGARLQPLQPLKIGLKGD